MDCHAMTSVTICTRGILAVFHSDLLFIERSCGTFWILIASRIWRFIGSLRHLSTTVMLKSWISSPWTLAQCFHNAFSVFFRRHSSICFPPLVNPFLPDSPKYLQTASPHSSHTNEYVTLSLQQSPPSSVLHWKQFCRPHLSPDHGLDLLNFCSKVTPDFSIILK